MPTFFSLFVKSIIPSLKRPHTVIISMFKFNHNFKLLWQPSIWKSKQCIFLQTFSFVSKAKTKKQNCIFLDIYLPICYGWLSWSLYFLRASNPEVVLHSNFASCNSLPVLRLVITWCQSGVKDSLKKVKVHLPVSCQQYWATRTKLSFLSDPGVPGVRSMGPDVSHTPFADLTDVTLADEDSNSIPTDDDNRAISGNVTMQVTPPGGTNWN